MDNKYIKKYTYISNMPEKLIHANRKINLIPTNSFV